MSALTHLWLCLLLPSASAGAVTLLRSRPNQREAVTLICALLLLLNVMALLVAMLEGAPSPEARFLEPLPGLPLVLRLEPLGMIFGVIASGLWLVSSIYSIGYMRANKEAHQTRFFVLFAVAIACTMGIALAGNLLTLFLFYELLTLATYPLVTHHGDDAARAGGRTYLGVLFSSSILFLLPAIALTWYWTGTLDFVEGGILGDKVSSTSATVLLALFVYGTGKAALMPIHRWLPAAMVAPTPVSALLHAVAVVKAGVFTVVKVIVYVFGIDTVPAAFGWLPYAAGFTIVAASIVALKSDNLKRRLAYSTISQLSYVILAAALLAPLSLVGAVLHIAAHAVGKITLFFAAGALYTAGHLTKVSELDGVGRRMPYTMVAFGIAALSMIGLPPAAGFVSKWFMVSGAFEIGHWFALIVILLSTLLNALYFLPIVYRAFFVAPPTDIPAHGEAPLAMVAALWVTTMLTLVMFIHPDVPLNLARRLLGVG